MTHPRPQEAYKVLGMLRKVQNKQQKSGDYLLNVWKPGSLIGLRPSGGAPGALEGGEPSALTQGIVLRRPWVNAADLEHCRVGQEFTYHTVQLPRDGRAGVCYLVEFLSWPIRAVNQILV